MTYLYCPEAPELRVGPGVREPSPDILRFQGGFAEIARDDPRYDEKMGWIKSTTSVHIEVLGEDRGGLTFGGNPSAFVCPQCETAGEIRAFETRQQLSGHLLSHARRAKS